MRTANALYREAVTAAGKDASLVAAANTAWGDLYLDTHDPGPAADLFRTALTADGTWAPAHAGLARALARENPPAAAAAAARAVELNPSLAEAHVFLARAALDADNPEDARAHLGRALAANPRSAEAYTLAAAMAYVSGRTDASRPPSRRRSRSTPSSARSTGWSPNSRRGHYRFDDAVALARKAIALDPTNAGAHGRCSVFT